MSENAVLNTCEVYELIIKSKSGQETSLVNAFLDFVFVEDMFSHYLEGILTIRDSNDFLKNFPIIGGEEVTFVFSDTNSARFLDLIVEGVLPQNQVSSGVVKNNDLMLKLTSVESNRAKQLRYSSTFKKNPYNIISDLLTIMGTKQTFDSSTINSITDEIEFVANFWNSDEMIRYICQQSLDSFFFQTTDGFKFGQLSEMVKQDATQQLYFANDIEGMAGINHVSEFTFDKYFSLNSLFNNKGFGKTVFQPSLENYSFEKETKKLSEIYDDYTLMGNNQPLLQTLSTYDNHIDVNHNDIQSATKRNIIIQTLQNYNVVAKLKGSVSRKVGDIVTFNLPPFDNRPINENFHNKWLILQIKHRISNNMSYKQNIRLFKNAFFNNSKVG